MMITVKMKYGGLYQGMLRKLPEGQRRGMKEAGLLWHRSYLKKHFEDNATRIYGYKRRTAKYEKRKLKKHGHRTPLVWTGTLRDAVIRYAEVRATPNRVRVRMLGPRWLKGKLAFRGRSGTGPDMMKELKTVTLPEHRELASAMKKEIVKWATVQRQASAAKTVNI